MQRSWQKDVSQLGAIEEKEQEIMREEEVRKIVSDLSGSGMSPSQIGHVLRDDYNLKIRKLTRQFPELDEDRSCHKDLSQKIRYMQLHLSKNKKDYTTQRSLVRALVKKKHLESRFLKSGTSEKN